MLRQSIAASRNRGVCTRSIRTTKHAATRKYTTKRAPRLPPFDFQPAPYTGLSKEEILEIRDEHLNPALFKYYKEPFLMAQGKMQYVWDEEGSRYLDAIGGIVTVSVGHCHPHVTAVAKQQMDLLQHSTTIYLHENIAKYAKNFASKFPGDLKVCYFVNSGSEANDLAMLMARLHTGNADMIALRNAYHGMSPSTMGLTAHHTWKYPVTQGTSVHHALCPDGYQGPFKYDDPDMASKYAWDVKNLIRTATTGSIAGFIAEPIQGVGGTVVMPQGYLEEVYGIVREHGGVCISDEVQTGFGRTGTSFWDFENHGVVPDIVTCAKGIGNGIPLAAVVTTPEIAKSLAQKIHFNTYGGNPVASAVGNAVLDVIDKEHIQRRALELGGLLKEKLEDLQKKYDFIGDVRGKGLMLGVEIVKDKKSRQPDGKTAALILEMLKENNLLIGKGGLDGNVLRIKPVMCLTAADVEYIGQVMDIVCSSIDGFVA